MAPLSKVSETPSSARTRRSSASSRSGDAIAEPLEPNLAMWSLADYFRSGLTCEVECALDGGQFQAAFLTGCWRGDPRIARGSDSLVRSGVCGCCKPHR